MPRLRYRDLKRPRRCDWCGRGAGAVLSPLLLGHSVRRIAIVVPPISAGTTARRGLLPTVGTGPSEVVVPAWGGGGPFPGQRREGANRGPSLEQPRSLAPLFDGLAQAQDFEAFRAASMVDNRVGLDLLYADHAGRVGVSTYTELPRRQALDPDALPDGLVPGDGGFEWELDAAGELVPVDADLLPWAVDPPRGFVVSGNNDPGGSNLDGDPTNDPTWYGGLFDIGTRAWQVERRLGEAVDRGGISLEDLGEIQQDTLSRPAERLLPFLLEAAERRPELLTGDMEGALAILGAWDARCELESTGPTLFQAWLGTLLRELFVDDLGGLLGEALLTDLDPGPGLLLATTALRVLEDTAEDIDAIEAGTLPFPSASGANLFDDGRTPEVETRDEILLRALSMAIDELGAACADPLDCPWGGVHTLHLDDLAEGLVPEAGGGPWPLVGGLNTVSVADAPLLRGGVVPAGWSVGNAPSNRFLIELDPAGVKGSWILPGGQSERPDDPHHLDQAESYVAGELAPLWFSAEEVAANTEDTWELEAGWAGGG